MNVIFGAGGFAKEVDFLLRQNNPAHTTNFFVTDKEGLPGIHNIDVISEQQFSSLPTSATEQIKAYIGIGNSKIRAFIYNRFNQYINIHFPNIISTTAVYDTVNSFNTMGEGNIVCSNTVLTTDITIGNHNHFNLGCTIGHDCSIGDYCTLSPGVHVSGNVRMGNHVFIGTGAAILEQVTIGNHVIIGAGAVVTKDITEPGTYVGIPAKKIK